MTTTIKPWSPPAGGIWQCGACDRRFHTLRAINHHLPEDECTGPATVSLVKDVWTPESAPLWWDDASYIRYQSDCGPEGEWIFELRVLDSPTVGSAPIVRHWVWWDEPSESTSREIRRLMARFDQLISDVHESGAADRAILDEGIWF